MLTILISGASGFIATNFMRYYAQQFNFILLSHKSKPGHVTMSQLETNLDLVDSVDIILNLAGANIGQKRWSKRRKQELLHSRIHTTRSLVSLFNRYDAKPYFISASAIGIYEPGIISDERTQIDYTKFNNFSQQLTKTWEQSAVLYRGKLIITRFGVVLDKEGGMLPQLVKQFRHYFGGRLGTGEQYMPWIALEDLLLALGFLIDKQLIGVCNMVSPQLTTNRELTTSLAEALKRPSWLHLPASVLHLLFGEMGQELMLNSILVKPNLLLEQGFNFTHPDLKRYLIMLLT